MIVDGEKRLYLGLALFNFYLTLYHLTYYIFIPIFGLNWLYISCIYHAQLKINHLFLLYYSIDFEVTSKKRIGNWNKIITRNFANWAGRLVHWMRDIFLVHHLSFLAHTKSSFSGMLQICNIPEKELFVWAKKRKMPHGAAHYPRLTSPQSKCILLHGRSKPYLKTTFLKIIMINYSSFKTCQQPTAKMFLCSGLILKFYKGGSSWQI